MIKILINENQCVLIRPDLSHRTASAASGSSIWLQQLKSAGPEQNKIQQIHSSFERMDLLNSNENQ